MSFVVAAILSGIIAGMLSGLVGIGGGVVLVPLLLYVFKVNMYTAAGTSLAIVLPTVIAGAINHFVRGNVDWRLALIIGLSSVVGSYLGVWAGSLLPAVSLKKIFAVILLVISINVLLDAYQLKPGARKAEPVPAAAVESRVKTDSPEE